MHRTISCKEYAGNCFRCKEYEAVALKYEEYSCFYNEGSESSSVFSSGNSAGSRLHTMSCNRAACFIALEKYCEANKQNK